MMPDKVEYFHCPDCGFKKVNGEGHGPTLEAGDYCPDCGKEIQPKEILRRQDIGVPLTDEGLPLGLKNQVHGTKAGSARRSIQCEWCKTRIEEGDAVYLYIWRTAFKPWRVEGVSCDECMNHEVGIPTVGCDEVIVKAHLSKSDQYPGYWYDFSDAAITDRQGPSVGSDCTTRDLEEWADSTNVPIERANE